MSVEFTPAMFLDAAEQYEVTCQLQLAYCDCVARDYVDGLHANMNMTKEIARHSLWSHSNNCIFKNLMKLLDNSPPVL